MRSIFGILLIPGLAWSASNECTTAGVLTQIRPGAAWVMQGDSMDRLKWLDRNTGKPSKSEVENARKSCMADVQARKAKKAQARLELKNPATPLEKKVDDLILLQDLDR